MFTADRQSSISIHCKRIDRIYRPFEKLEGKVVVDAYKGWQHQGLRLYATGWVGCYISDEVYLSIAISH